MSVNCGIERAEPGGVRVRRALLSVSEKTGIVELAEDLVELGVEMVSTGGTARTLAQAGVAVRAIEDFTGFPEMMDGRLKTLHPRLYAGLLAVRDDEAHLKAAAEHGIEPVDLVCVNLYPFEQTVARGDASDAEIVENIDVGGPTMIRAAAKNHAFAAVLVDPADYAIVLAELRESGARLSMATRERLAGKAFACTARYDASISSWFARRAEEDFPVQRAIAYEKAAELRYGENPHQRAAYYAEVGAPTHLLAGVAQLHGKELSFNNLLDLSAARELVEDFSEPACAIVKHNNPCGCALGRTAQDAYERAFACDEMSAYGGVIALNRPVDAACAQALVGAVRRGPARPELRCAGAGGADAEEERAPAGAARVARAGRGPRGEAGDRRPARAGPRRSRGDPRPDARDDGEEPHRARVGGSALRLAGVPATYAPTRS